MRLAGHPLHPMLVHFPIASWTGAVAIDLGNRIWGLEILATAGFACLAAGLSIGALAILAGFIDYTAIAEEHPAQRTAVGHMYVMSAAWLVFLASLTLRGFVPQSAPSIWATGTETGGLIVMLFGAWLGGNLVYRFGVGVRSGTPSSSWFASSPTVRDATRSMRRAP